MHNEEAAAVAGLAPAEADAAVAGISPAPVCPPVPGDAAVAGASAVPANPDELYTQCVDEPHQGVYKILWHRKWNRPTTNANGTTGWAEILETTNDQLHFGKITRVHLCARTPCTARYKANKYGVFPVPVHMQSLTPAEAAHAKLALAPPLPPAHAEPSLVPAAIEPPAMPLPPSVDAPAPEDIALLAFERDLRELVEPVGLPPTVVQQVEPSPSPASAPLLGMCPPAPAAPVGIVHADPTAVAAGHAAVSSVRHAENQILHTLLTLAREIRKPRAYIGYSAFVLMGLLKKARPWVWEGESKIDLMSTFTPWALVDYKIDCAVDAVCCVVEAQPGGYAQLFPISEVRPLELCRHFVACATIGDAMDELDEKVTEFERLYSQKGVVVLGTVCDGDCGIDVMTQMLSLPQTLKARNQLRIDLSDYLIARIDEPWMHDLMVLCGELRPDVLVKFRSEGTVIPDGASVKEAFFAVTAVADAASNTTDNIEAAARANLAKDDDTLAAMRWSTGLQDEGALLSLIQELPIQIVHEQINLYQAREIKEQTAEHPRKITVRPSAVICKDEVGKAFHMYCTDQGIDTKKRLPHGITETFINDRLEWKTKDKMKVLTKRIRRWHSDWVKSNKFLDMPQSRAPKKGASIKKKLCWKRKRREGGGAKHKAAIVRQTLYEWWAGLRYAVDWQKHAANRSARKKKVMGRFPRSVLRAKLTQLLTDYAYAALLNGEKVDTFLPDARWFRHWQDEYGLSMRKANRRYQVPKNVLMERLEIFWLNLFRLRLLMKLLLGYEPQLENFDQSPYHNNEVGSQDKPVLAVKGGKVPLIEGNSDVKQRWTANLTTFSNVDRIGKGELPYCELMFKAAADGRVAARLKNYIRSRGFPKWFSVTTAPKGSYRELDIIEFLNTHLEKWTEGRDWRILLADDFAAHKTMNIRNLCWSRGYILVLHGGGATPITQTPDTDLNEYVRREYGKIESHLLLQKMRDGVSVPSSKHEECIEIMYEVLSQRSIHIRAAGGYKSTGATVDLSGTEDPLIVREAATFWNELGMRAKIDKELAAVAEEVHEGALTWCRRDVERLITPYPPRPHVDKIIANLGEDMYLDDDEKGDEGEVAQAAVADTSESSGDEGVDLDVPADPVAPDDVSVLLENDGEVVAEVAEPAAVLVALSAEQADQVHAIQTNMSALHESIAALRAVGHLGAAQGLEIELAKERRRQRAIVQMSPAVAASFQQRRDAEDQETRLRKRLADEQNKREVHAAKVKAELERANDELKKRKREIQEYENLAEAKHAMKTYTVESLGQGSANAGGVQARKKRLEVLDRMARLGAGLSASQRNDWPWFKEAWDAEMVKTHGEDWAVLFAGYIQQQLDKHNGGVTNAFSTFVHSEACRVFHDKAALHIP